MTIGKAITYLIDFYYQAKDSDYIRKPIAWSLYQTWKIIDAKEKTKSEESE